MPIYPPITESVLPGQNSTIIRIHGGGWTTGNKGLDNMMQMNKYFAAQGYCVFDIQYGLNNESSILASLKFITPLNVQGNFSINDMVSQIGSFCQFLTVHQADYGVNLSSVFILGGVGWGQLRVDGIRNSQWKLSINFWYGHNYSRIYSLLPSKSRSKLC